MNYTVYIVKREHGVDLERFKKRQMKGVHTSTWSLYSGHDKEPAPDKGEVGVLGKYLCYVLTFQIQERLETNRKLPYLLVRFFLILCHL